MKLKVISGYIDPLDRAHKAGRRGLVLGAQTRDGRRYLLVAPATTYYARKGTVPPGHVLLQVGSPARKRSGFDPIDILINIRDARWLAEDSYWLDGHTVIGQLDLSADKRIKARFAEELRAFPPQEVYYE
jgi:hypothetical protein